jgi:hypothetical protein
VYQFRDDFNGYLLISGVAHSDILHGIEDRIEEAQTAWWTQLLLPLPFNSMANDPGNARKIDNIDDVDEGVLKNGSCTVADGRMYRKVRALGSVTLRVSLMYRTADLISNLYDTG